LAARHGRLRRNFQGYTDDPAPVLLPIGPSSIGRFAGGFVQNASAADVWSRAVEAGCLPVARGLSLTAEDILRAAVIERLMCDLTVDVDAVCRSHGFDPAALDDAVAAAATLQPDGLCRVEGRQVSIPADAYRLMRVTAACFDAGLADAGQRHARAV
jgi:oxygen-independent coproporphyrinogen-3 oxidase